MVQMAVAAGIDLEDVARYLQLTPWTMNRLYHFEIANGATIANTAVAKRLFDIATKGKGKEAVTACIFWCKTKLGWRETYRLENTGKDGGAQEHVVTVKGSRPATDFDVMTPQQLDDFISDAVAKH
jgi:hypothetical protein